MWKFSNRFFKLDHLLLAGYKRSIFWTFRSVKVQKSTSEFSHGSVFSMNETQSMIFINWEMAKNKVRLQRDFDPTVRVLRLVQFAEVKVFVYGWSRFIALYQLFAAPAPHCWYIEPRNREKSLRHIWQRFSWLLDEWIAKISKKKFFHGGFLR